jgi:AcrR family transcriptional regulator
MVGFGGRTMPKQTFFNLPEDKRNTLIEAAEKEFSTVPLMKASISNIIKMAGIPRGSFYQYFENIEDLYFYLLNETTKKSKENFILLLKKHDGDIIDAITEMYYQFLVQLPDEEEHTFLKNAVLNITYKSEYSLSEVFGSAEQNEHFKKMTKLINKKHLNITEDKELYHILQIITAVAFRNFVEKFSKKLTDDEAIHNFTMEMNLLKRGLYKQE